MAPDDRALARTLAMTRKAASYRRKRRGRLGQETLDLFLYRHSEGCELDGGRVDARLLGRGQPGPEILGLGAGRKCRLMRGARGRPARLSPRGLDVRTSSPRPAPT